MNLHVLSEVCLEPESFCATLFCAFVSVFSDVQSFVLVEISVLSERL